MGDDSDIGTNVSRHHRDVASSARPADQLGEERKRLGHRPQHTATPARRTFSQLEQRSTGNALSSQPAIFRSIGSLGSSAARDHKGRPLPVNR
jgi:hypothetical protein